MNNLKMDNNANNNNESPILLNLENNSIPSNNENININKNLSKEYDKLQDEEIKSKKEIINSDNNELENNKLNSNENYKEKNNDKKIIKLNIFNEIKYGIDENGNPMNINEYYKNINKNNIKKKPVAYIIKDKNNENILVDLKGNKIIDKNKDGDYEFPFHFKILIKAFDVKHPELRVNGERDFEQNDIIENNNYNKEQNKKIINKIIKKDKNIDEKSFQRNTMETNDSSNLQINKNLNSLFKKNAENTKEIMSLWKLRYGNNNISKNNIIEKPLKEEILPGFKNIKIKSKREFKNHSYNKIINISNNQEIILRTNKILNLTKSIDNIYYKKNHKYNKKCLNKNKTKKNKNINKEYLPKKNISISPIKNDNKMNTYNNKNNNKFKYNRVIYSTIFSNLNSESNLINNSQKNNRNSVTNNDFNNQINKYSSFSTLITTPSVGLNSTKSKKIFNGLNSNSTNSIFCSFNNTINNNNFNRINNLINKDLFIRLSDNQNDENKNKENLFKNTNYHKKKVFNKCFSKDNIDKNKNNIYQKSIKKRNILIPSNIRSIDFSESSLIELINKENNDNNYNIKNFDEKYKNKKKINNNKKCKLTKRIPIAPKKTNPNDKERYSILSKEANNMIKEFILEKNNIINKKNQLKIAFSNNSKIVKKLNSYRINNKKNFSFNKEKKSAVLYTDFF